MATLKVIFADTVMPLKLIVPTLHISVCASNLTLIFILVYSHLSCYFAITSVDFSNLNNVLTNLNSMTAVKPALIPLLLARLRGHKFDPSDSESPPALPVGLKLLVKVALIAIVAVVFHYLSNN